MTGFLHFQRLDLVTNFIRFSLIKQIKTTIRIDYLFHFLYKNPQVAISQLHNKILKSIILHKENRVKK